MIDYELLKPEDYDQLPEEPERQFLEIERLARQRMYQILEGSDDNQFEHDVRVQYMVTVSAAAEETGINDITYPTNGNDFSDNYDWFQRQVHGRITRLRLRNAKTTSVHTVQLTNRSRGRIELEIVKLRDVIDSADLSDSKKAALNKRLDELQAEIGKSRVSFGIVMSVIAYVSGSMCLGVSTIAAAPTALATITGLMGQDKEAEEAEIKRIGAPPKALPPPVVPKTRPRPAAFDSDLDDDVPF